MGIDLEEKPTWGLVLWGSILPAFLGIWLVFLPRFSIIAAFLVLFLYIAFWVYFLGLYWQERYALARVGFLAVTSLFFLGFPLRLGPANVVGVIVSILLLLTYVGILAIALFNIQSTGGIYPQNASQPGKLKIGSTFLIGAVGTVAILLAQSLTGSLALMRIFLAVAGYICACGFGWLTVQQGYTRRKL